MSEPAHEGLVARTLDKIEGGLEHLAAHKGEPVTEPANPTVADPPPHPVSSFGAIPEAAQTFNVPEVVHFHAPNSFFELNADRIEVSHDLVAHPHQATGPAVKVLTLVAYNAGNEPTVVQLDQPTAFALAAAITNGFSG